MCGQWRMRFGVMTSSNYVKIGEELNMLETKVYFGQSIYQNDGIQEHFVQNVSCLYKSDGIKDKTILINTVSNMTSLRFHFFFCY